jgi:hypothetical protein
MRSKAMIKASQLREDIYNLLDRVIETGTPLEIKRKGRTLRIVLEKKSGKLVNLKKREVMSMPPENYVHLDWSKQWKYGD